MRKTYFILRIGYFIRKICDNDEVSGHIIKTSPFQCNRLKLIIYQTIKNNNRHLRSFSLVTRK